MEQLVRDVMTCPLSTVIMQDPVFAADGFVYERVAIQDWIRTHGLTSPVTRQGMDHAYLTPAACTQLLKKIYTVIKRNEQQAQKKVYTFEINKCHLGYVIGKKGHTIRDISKKTGTCISIDQSAPNPIIQLKGGNIEYAITLLNAVINKSVFLEKHSHGLNAKQK